jgi:hypothetical protein
VVWGRIKGRTIEIHPPASEADAALPNMSVAYAAEEILRRFTPHATVNLVTTLPEAPGTLTTGAL